MNIRRSMILKESPGNHFENRPGGGNALLAFDHGLGDFCNFMGILPAIKETYPKWKITIAHEKFRQFDKLYPGLCVPNENFRNARKRYSYFYKIQYPEPEFGNGVLQDKPTCCAVREFGIVNLKWYPAKINKFDKIKKKSRGNGRIGVHFDGDSSSDKKTASIKIAEKIWKTIEKSGFEPFEIHMQKPDQPGRLLPFISLNQTLRYNKPSLIEMAKTIASCDYFIGIDSGPLYFALMILGINRCIGLELKNPIFRYAPCDLKATLDIDERYFDANVLKRLLLNERKNQNVVMLPR